KDKLIFHPYFSRKDLVGAVSALSLLVVIRMRKPYELGDPENFIRANPIVTPIHIQPEWYFLFAYAILRSIPNKLGGVTALALSLFVLILPAIFSSLKQKSTKFYPIPHRLF